jgi:hypothetical protein
MTTLSKYQPEAGPIEEINEMNYFVSLTNEFHHDQFEFFRFVLIKQLRYEKYQPKKIIFLNESLFSNLFLLDFFRIYFYFLMNIPMDDLYIKHHLIIKTKSNL